MPQTKDKAKKSQKLEPIPAKPQRKVKPPDADGHRQRMLQRLIHTVDYRIPQREVLEMLLYYSIPVCDTRDQAVHLMHDNDRKLINVLKADTEKLCRVRGIGPKSSKLLHAVGAIVKRGLIFDQLTPAKAPPSITDPETIAHLLSQRIGIPTKHETWIASFNSAMQLQQIHQFCEYELTTSPPHMNLLLNYVLQNKVSNLVIAKACPGHAIVPSMAELSFASHVMELFYHMECTVVDYVIVNESSVLLSSEYMT